MRFILALFLITPLIAELGCSQAKPSGPPPTVISPDIYSQEVYQNRVRLAGEDDLTLKEEADDSMALVPFAAVGRAYDYLIADPITRSVDYLTGDTPGRAAQKFLDPESPDNRRSGILREADWKFGRRVPYTRLYRDIAATDPDYTVRAGALRALNRARDRDSTAVFIKSMEDEQQLVRLEAAKALANVPDPKSVPALIKHVQNDPSGNVRIACADGLRNFKRGEVARVLVQLLDDRDFSVSWQALQSLRLLTAHDFQYDGRAWLKYLASENDPFG